MTDALLMEAPQVIPAANPALLSVRNLSLGIKATGSHLVSDVSFDLERGQTLGVVGESGSGKSLTALALAGLLPSGIGIFSGSVRLNGQNILNASPAARRNLFRGTLGFVFQNPLTALNPRLSVLQHLYETLPRHERRIEHAEHLLSSVGIATPRRILSSFPHELSGGLGQRAMIAIAIAHRPRLLIADEPTTALDVTVQAKVLDLLQDIQSRLGLSVLLISHDIGVISDRCDRVAVMRGGRVVEEGSVASVIDRPHHDYTHQLLAARPAHLQLERLVPAEPADVALRLSSVSKTFRDPGGREHTALWPTDLVIPRGASIGIVGESGSGKTTLARIAAGLAHADAGELHLDDQRIDVSRQADRDRLWGTVQYVFQNTSGSLDPRLPVRRTLELALAGARRAGVEHPETAADLLDAVNLAPALGERLPGQLSGGQRQRIVIARALARQPRILIADEPVSALDLTVQAHILRLLARLRRERSMTLILISHDLDVVRHLTEQVVVMTQGRIVETGASNQIFDRPAHAYTQKLVASIPGRQSVLISAQGNSLT